MTIYSGGALGSGHIQRDGSSARERDMDALAA